jgi:nitroimidazol reductase NimA-like FMN-containing flavoprotein (pyridoxamine 5'-phosphate oxidase superfamily)
VTAQPETQPELDELTRDECFRVVASHSIGRIAVAPPDRSPYVVPVNYVLDLEMVVFRSDPGTKLDVAPQHPVSFQVDDFDPYHRTGWSVLLQGSAAEVPPPEVSHLGLESWVGGAKAHWIRVVPVVVTGRRIHLPDAAPDERGYL